MDNLALSVFESHVGSIFKVVIDSNRKIDLVLVSAERMSIAGPSFSPDSDRPFSLLFRGPEAHAFGQGIQRLSHSVMGEMEIFLVPMQPDADGPLYEAVFA